MKCDHSEITLSYHKIMIYVWKCRESLDISYLEDKFAQICLIFCKESDNGILHFNRLNITVYDIIQSFF